jgi:hypothetical protein
MAHIVAATQGDSAVWHIQMREDAPQRSDRVEYLKALLARDPGVFLERHGEQLGTQDLQLFEDLRTDYEVHVSGVVLYTHTIAPTDCGHHT